MKIKYVSFDIYDTLIKRILPLEKLYDFMGKELRNEYKINIENFREKRILAQKLAKTKFGYNYNLEEIYLSFPDKLSEKEVEIIIRLEKESEIKNTIVNKEGLNLYNKYKNDYHIICISDMYLDKDTINKILTKNGYKVEATYVSCEERLSKREKKLFLKVLKNLKIKSKELLHIGDAKRSDYLNPKLLGINSKIINNKSKEKDYYYDIGFKIFAPMMYEFCKFINKNSVDRKLVFVSREGDFIKKCYNIIYPNEETEMIYISRKSVTLGTISIFLKNNSFKELLRIISIKRNETVEELFKRLGLDINKYSQELKEYNIDFTSNINNLVENFFEDYKSSIINDTKEFNDLFSKYILNVFSKRNTLVDIGWKGSMQDLLNNYLHATNNKNVINGIYLGVMDNRNKAGYLFNENNEDCQNILDYSGLLEIIMMPNYGSVIAYKEGRKGVVPMFDEVEFSKQSLSIIKNIQLGIIDYINNIKIFNNCIEFKREEIIDILNKFALIPKIKDINYFKNLDFYDNDIKYHLVEPFSLKNIKSNFLNTKWKTAYLKNLFKINLPYNKLINKIRKGKHEDA